MDDAVCTGGPGCGTYATYWCCRKHSIGCFCQYGPVTPDWYVSVRDCPVHASRYRPDHAPDWWNVHANTLKEGAVT